MVMSIFGRKTKITAPEPIEVISPRIIRHPLTREQAQVRGALGNAKKRERREVEALVMASLREKAPLIYLLGETFPSYRKKLIFEKPELLEVLLRLFGDHGPGPIDQAQPQGRGVPVDALEAPRSHAGGSFGSLPLPDYQTEAHEV